MQLAEEGASVDVSLRSGKHHQGPEVTESSQGGILFDLGFRGLGPCLVYAMGKRKREGEHGHGACPKAMPESGVPSVAQLVC